MDVKDAEWTPTSVRCPYCNRTVPSRRAHREKPLYEHSGGEVWGEMGVLTFDYEGYRVGAVHKSLRREWFLEGEEILYICECVFGVAYEEKCREIKIPSGLSKKSFSNFEVYDENREAYQACAEYSLSFRNEPVRGVGIYGPTGVGKTHLAAAVVHQILTDKIKRGEECSAGFYSVPKLLQELRWWRKDEAVKEERTTFGHLSDKAIVVLDDLGVSECSPEQLGELFLIVDGRITNEKPIIVTTNVDPRLLDGMLGDRVADRLREACTWYQIGGQSRRGRSG